MTARRVMVAAVLALAVSAAGCGDDDDSADGATEPADTVAADDASSDDEADGGGDDGGGDQGGDESAAPAGDAGTLTFGGETIEMENVGCFLEEQPRAGLGGTFEFSIQGRGTNAAGEAVIIDITRVRPDEDGGPLGNQEPADEVKIDIGDPGSGTSYTGDGPVGTVTVDGSSVTASGIQVSALSGPEAVEVAFDLGCTGF